MLHRSFTAVVERNTTFAESFITEPYETGWAKEARWFVRVLGLSPGARLSLLTQLSPDGLFWCDAEGPGLTIAAPGTYTLGTPGNFGHWLALKGELTQAAAEAEGGDGLAEAGEPRVKLIIYLALKE